MKKIRCLLVFWIALLMFSQITSARSFSTKPCYFGGVPNTPNNQWSFVERWENNGVYYLNWNVDWTYTYKYNEQTWNNLTQLDSRNAWDYFACNLYYYSNYTNWYQQSNYNFIKVFKPTNLWETTWDFYWWNESSRSYRSFHTPWNWYVDDDWNPYDMWFPRHWTIVLYSSTTKRTIQFIGKHVLRDKILFFDPLEPDQNLWVISFYEGKAWSLNMQSDYRYYLFGMWDLDDVMLSDLDYEYSYNILTWWTYFRPNTAWQLNIYPTSSPTTIWRFTEVGAMWLTFTYQTDLEYTPPPFIDNSLVDYWSWNWVNSDMTARNNYQACERDYSYRNFIVSSRKACASDYQNQLITADSYHRVMDYVFEYANIRNENTTWELQEFFSGYDYSNANGCQWLIANAQTLVKLYNLRWDPYDYGYYSDVVSELKYISQENPYNITQQCWDRPAVPTEYQSVTNSSNICNLDSWSNIVNCFKFWSNSAWTWDWTYFDLAIDNIKSLVWSAFDSEFLSPIRDNYNQGKWVIRYGVSCDVNNNLLKIPYIDYVVWLIAILIFFLLFWML